MADGFKTPKKWLTINWILFTAIAVSFFFIVWGYFKGFDWAEDYSPLLGTLIIACVSSLAITHNIIFNLRNEFKRDRESEAKKRHEADMALIAAANRVLLAINIIQMKLSNYQARYKPIYLKNNKFNRGLQFQRTPPDPIHVDIDAVIPDLHPIQELFNTFDKQADVPQNLLFCNIIDLQWLADSASVIPTRWNMRNEAVEELYSKCDKETQPDGKVLLHNMEETVSFGELSSLLHMTEELVFFTDEIIRGCYFAMKNLPTAVSRFVLEENKKKLINFVFSENDVKTYTRVLDVLSEEESQKLNGTQYPHP